MKKIKKLKKWIAEKGNQNKPFEKETIGKAAEWLINNAKKEWRGYFILRKKNGRWIDHIFGRNIK